MFNFQENLEELQDKIQEAIDSIPRYLPNLQNPNPASCVLIYVMTPDPETEVIGDFVFVASPGEFYLMMRGREALGGGPADLSAIQGIFPVNEPDEAVSLAHSLLEELEKPGEAAESNENEE